MIRARFLAWTGILLFTTIFLTNLGPIQPLGQYIPMTLSLGAERLEMKLRTHLLYVSKL
jgi:hypothetical protein